MSEPEKKTPEMNFIKGTSNKPEYLVVAQNGKVVLGIKPRLDAVGRLGIIPGLRIRSTYADKSLHAEAVPISGNVDCATAWPNIPFTKIDESTRASMMIGMFVLADPKRHEHVSKALEKSQAVDELCKWIMRRVPEKFAVVSPEQMAEFVDSVLKYKYSPCVKAGVVGQTITAVESYGDLQAAIQEAYPKLKDDMIDPDPYKEKAILKTSAEGAGSSGSSALADALGMAKGGGAKSGKSLLDEIFGKVTATDDKGIRDQLVGLFGHHNLTIGDPDHFVTEYKNWLKTKQVPATPDEGASAEGESNVISLWGGKSEGSDKKSPGWNTPAEKGVEVDLKPTEVWTDWFAVFGDTDMGKVIWEIGGKYPGVGTPGDVYGLLMDALEEVDAKTLIDAFEEVNGPMDEIDRDAAIDSVEELDLSEGPAEAHGHHAWDVIQPWFDGWLKAQGFKSKKGE